MDQIWWHCPLWASCLLSTMKFIHHSPHFISETLMKDSLCLRSALPFSKVAEFHYWQNAPFISVPCVQDVQVSYNYWGQNVPWLWVIADPVMYMCCKLRRQEVISMSMMEIVTRLQIFSPTNGSKLALQLLVGPAAKAKPPERMDRR